MKRIFGVFGLIALVAGCDDASMAALGGGGASGLGASALMGEPLVSTVTVGSQSYTVRRITNDRVPVVNLIGSIEVQPDGSEVIVAPASGGVKIANSVRVAGATGLVEAAGVMLRVCGKDPSQAPLWAPEPVPFQTDTAEFVFSDVC
jgi:hypothetical protein